MDGFIAQRLIVLPDEILIKAAQHPLVAPLYVTDTGHFPDAQYHYRERPCGTESFILIYCSEGEGWVQLEEGKKHPLRKGFAAVIPAGVPHKYASSETRPWSIYWWHMKGEQAALFFEGYDKQSAPVLLAVDQTTTLLNLFEEGYRILQKGYSLSHMIYVSQLACHAAVLLKFPQVQAEGAKQIKQPKSVTEETIRYMTEHLQGQLSLTDLAANAKLSVPHLTATFKHATGYSPIDYYLRLKIQRACQLLDLSDQSIKEVSHNLGFNDPYYFSRLFKKIMGKPPAEYRATRKG